MKFDVGLGNNYCKIAPSFIFFWKSDVKNHPLFDHLFLTNLSQKHKMFFKTKLGLAQICNNNFLIKHQISQHLKKIDNICSYLQKVIIIFKFSNFPLFGSFALLYYIISTFFPFFRQSQLLSLPSPSCIYKILLISVFNFFSFSAAIFSTLRKISWIWII